MLDKLAFICYNKGVKSRFFEIAVLHPTEERGLERLGNLFSNFRRNFLAAFVFGKRKAL